MADQTSVLPTAPTPIPVFKGEGYDYWNIRMKTILKSRDLWDLVESGIDSKETDQTKIKSMRKRDAHAMALIQQAVHDTLFSRIAAAETAKESWEILKLEFQGDTEVKAIKLQGLRRDFENLVMKEGEMVGDYFSRVMAIVSQKRSYGEEVTEQVIVEKVLRSLTSKFDFVVPSIEVAYDLSKLSPVKLMGSLQSQEQRMLSRSSENSNAEKTEEHALQVIQDNNRSQNTSGFRGRGRGTTRGRGRGRNMDRSRVPQCYVCKKYGHTSKECWYNQDTQVNVAETNEKEETSEEQHLFMACIEDDKFCLMIKSDQVYNNNLWFIDSGCSNHMTGSRSSFIHLDETFKVDVQLGNKKKLAIEGKGTVRINAGSNGSRLLDDVYYAPSLEYNLLSVGQLMKKGYSLLFERDECIIKNNGEVIMKIHILANNMFLLDVSSPEVTTTGGDSSSQLWHKRFAHLNFDSMKLLHDKNMVTGIPRIRRTTKCEGCLLGKHTRTPFTSHSWRAKARLELVHADLCGPMQVQSLGHSLYYFLLIDDLTRMSWVYFLSKKSEAFDKFKVFKQLVEKQCQGFIKVLRTDRGGEFCSKEFNSFCEEQGIRRELTTPHTPQLNGVVERKNRTIMGMVRSMLKDKEMPNFLWAEAVATAVYILNRSPTSAVEGKTPLQAWSGETPDVSKLRVFGSIAYKHVYAHGRKKLDDRSQRMVMIGYSAQSPSGYRLLDPVTRKVEATRDATIIEEAAWNWKEKSKSEKADFNVAFDDPFSVEVLSQSEDGPTPYVESTPTNINMQQTSSYQMSPSSSVGTTIDASSSQSMQTPLNIRPLSDIYATTQPLEPEEYIHLQFALSICDPLCFDDAAHKKVWQVAMAEEIAAIEKNNTWELVPLPAGKNIVGVKWLFKSKLGANGQVIRHKARLVAKGYSQKKGVDFEETFAPVARFETIRVVLAVAAQRGWLVHQLDVKSAFLNGELDEDIYVEQPEGYKLKNSEDKVYKLKKALYGLKQAPRAWYAKIDGYFTKNGYNRSLNEPTLYVKQVSNNDIIYVCLYVDDIICTSSCESLVSEFKQGMQEVFEMTDMGLLQYFLGLEVKQSTDGIFVSQGQYARNLLDKFQMKGSKFEALPMSPGDKPQLEDGEDKVNETLYRSLVGGLMYLTHTRPDLAFSVGVLARFMQSPSKQHLAAAKKVLRYIGGTVDLGLKYERRNDLQLVGYTDSDWAGCKDDSKSVSANVFLLGNGAVSWCSKKQKTVALSSTEAEYISATTGACQAIWLKRILYDLGINQQKETILFCDSKSAINLSKNPVMNSRSKHIELRYHFIRDMVNQGQVKLEFCGTNEQLADLMTKAVPREKLVHLRFKIGVQECVSRGGVESDTTLPFMKSDVEACKGKLSARG
ncbi:putative RNA-directed DNA polymerase [Helianthus annuus]|nr:putative RNA-directed DNA polymerase [Helianthus annuus]KAJ0729954.1 putative RNA-directed DNA polymerase [Helianthus annuus]